ncbi:MAG: ACT domain-containing protein, partial [Rhodospirillales bacterium]|nr:ACT domain-containing protein [Rhodospirillales bacterium]
ETLSDWPEDNIQAHLDRGHAKYWLSFNADTLAHHANMIRDTEAKGLMLHIESRVEADRDVTEVMIYTQDHPGVFAAIAGAMSLSGASIVDAKIATLANGMALDTFWVQDSNGDAFADKGRLKRLLARIEDALSGRIKPARELKSAQEKALPSRIGAFKVPARVLIDNKASNSHTVVEINGRDRPGLLHDLTTALTASGLQIASAHISTYGERVVDVFYIKDIFGLKVDNEEKTKALHASLLEIVSSSSASKQDSGQGPGQGKAAAKDEVKAAG